MLEDMDAALPQIYRFPSLQSLSLVRQASGDGPGHNASPEMIDGQQLDIKTGGLTRLSISGDVVWRREAFSGLQEFELIFTDSLAGFADVLRHCVALTTLTMLPHFVGPDEIFAALNSHPDALSHLVAFKYLGAVGSMGATFEQIEALCEFLKGKKHLRMLDVGFSGDNRDEDVFLELLPELPALEVLGFDFMRGNWKPDDIAFFERVIPPRLTALRVGHRVLVDEPKACQAPYRAGWLNLVRPYSLPSTGTAPTKY